MNLRNILPNVRKHSAKFKDIFFDFGPSVRARGGRSQGIHAESEFQAHMGPKSIQEPILRNLRKTRKSMEATSLARRLVGGFGFLRWVRNRSRGPLAPTEFSPPGGALGTP